MKNSNETLPREVAFRINAIRETFEETGILLSTNPAAEQGKPKIEKKIIKTIQL